MIHLCLLAAGQGSRFGKNKLLEQVADRPLWEHGYDAIRQAGEAVGGALHVVTRYGEILTRAGENGVYCPEAAEGLSHSVRAALRACGNVRDGDRILFLAADQPWITPETLCRLLTVPLADARDSTLPFAACVWDGERSGNPVVFSGVLREKLMALTGEQGGKTVLRDCPGRMARVLCDPAELRDIDLPEDLRQIGQPTF